VDVRNRADFARFQKHFDERAVVDHHAFLFVDHETFKACNAFVYGGGKFV